MTTNTETTSPLVDHETLLTALFGDSKPTRRWLEHQMARNIVPFYRIGRIVRFDVAEVRAALDKNCLVKAKAA